MQYKSENLEITMLIKVFVGFHPTFLRHDIARTNPALPVWLNQNSPLI